MLNFSTRAADVGVPADRHVLCHTCHVHFRSSFKRGNDNPPYDRICLPFISREEFGCCRFV